MITGQLKVVVVTRVPCFRDQTLFEVLGRNVGAWDFFNLMIECLNLGL